MLGMMKRLPLTFLALGLLVAGCQSPAAPVAGLPSPPPWAAPADTEARIRAAGLEPLPGESFVMHIHSQLNVFYNGQPVEVPANIGIDPKGAFISAVHSHAASGVIHVESPVLRDFTLGQFFTEWGVPLDGAKVYVGGQPVTETSGLVLKDNQVIAVVFGTPPATIPATYTGRWL